MCKFIRCEQILSNDVKTCVHLYNCCEQSAVYFSFPTVLRLIDMLFSVFTHTEPAAITPPISNKDISSYYVGDPILMGCSVDTCATGITMQFLFNDSILAEARPSPTDERAYTMSLPAQLDSAGTYTCRVTTDSPSYLIQQSFNVTGTAGYTFTIVHCIHVFAIV